MIVDVEIKFLISLVTCRQFSGSKSPEFQIVSAHDDAAGKLGFAEPSRFSGRQRDSLQVNAGRAS